MTGRRIDYTIFSLDIGDGRDQEKLSLCCHFNHVRTCSPRCCLPCVQNCFFHPSTSSTIDSPAHRVSARIRQPGDKSSVVTSFETDLCVHRKYNKMSGAYIGGILLRVASGWFFWSMAADSWHFQVASLHLQSTMGLCLLHIRNSISILPSRASVAGGLVARGTKHLVYQYQILL